MREAGEGTGDWFKTNTWTEENWFEERKKDIAELVKKGKGSAPPNGGGFGGEESAEIQDLKAQIQDLEASNANFRQNCTWLTSELLDLRISNTQESQRLANAADTSSASMREAAAEILSLSDAYERSKTEERRLLAALEQSTERNMATNAKLSVTQARLTGYAREIDVLERRLRDVADELRVTEEELRTTEEEFAEYRLCDSSGSDDEDTATPAIAIAEPVLQDTPAAACPSPTPASLPPAEWLALCESSEYHERHVRLHDRLKRRCACCGKTGKPKLKKCSICKQVWYCNTECQKANWKAHKPDCKPDGGPNSAKR